VTPSGQSTAPITTQLKRLLAERGLSYRALAALTREHDPRGRGVGHAYLVGLASGAEYPSRRSLELIAASLGLDPAVFAKHRIATLRDQLDGRRVGFEEAWRRYRQLAG
jgi:transcriptional regulator with XRE-family HTH domain